MSWESVQIKYVMQVVTKGTTPTKAQGFSNSGINYIKAEALNGDTALDFSNKYYISEEVHQTLKRSQLSCDDVLVTIAGANIGKCGIVEEHHLPANTNQAVGIIRCNTQKIFPRFLYYWFKQKKTFKFIQSLNAQAAQPNINLETLKGIEIAMPSLSLQKRIATILSSYDFLIENNRRRIQLLEESARLLYEEWFVRLRFPGHEHVKIVDGIPEGWEKKLISNVCETVGGGTPKTNNSEYWGNEITWVVPTDITRNNCLYLMSSERSITEKGLKNSSAKLLPPFTILMTSRASVGYFAMMDYAVCTNQGFINIIPHNFEHKMYYLFNLLSRVDEIRSNAKGSTYPEISKGRFREMSIILPSSDIISKFCMHTESVFKQICSIKKQNRMATQARDLLLPKLMNGEIAL